LPDFLGTTYQNGGKYTKLPQNIPNGRKIRPNVIKYKSSIAKRGVI
jgi:hypothetical protein